MGKSFRNRKRVFDDDFQQEPTTEEQKSKTRRRKTKKTEYLDEVADVDMYKWVDPEG